MRYRRIHTFESNRLGEGGGEGHFPPGLVRPEEAEQEHEEGNF